MAEEELSKKLLQDWVRRRAAAVREKYSAFDAAIEIGVEGISDDQTPTQIFCPFHHNTSTMAARYYPPSGHRGGYIRCYTCKENWDSINIIAKARGKRFMDALQELERRYRIHVPKRPEAPEYVEPTERGAAYESDKWADIPRVLDLLEAKLLRLRDQCGMPDYVKFCRVLDAVSYDFDKTAKATPEMSAVLRKLMSRMDEVKYLADMQDGMDDGQSQP